MTRRLITLAFGLFAVALAVATFGSAPALAQGGRTPPMPDWWPGSQARLLARAQIDALATEYYYRIDHGDAEGVAELFTPDAIFHPGGVAPIVGRDAIRTYYARRPRSWLTRHVTTNLRLAFIDDDHVEAVRIFTHYFGDTSKAPGPYPAYPSVAEYRESVVRGADGMWRYSSRVATALFARSR
jgi:uncharacterized protein (TIGR02246 family)